METTPTKFTVKKFFPRGKNIWLSYHDASALSKILRRGDGLSDSARKRLRQELFNGILKPLYCYTVSCTQCGCKMDVVYDEKITYAEVSKRNVVSGLEDLGIICSSCVEDYK